MATGKASLGTASLWCSILGAVLPLCLAVLMPGQAFHCRVLFGTLELMALGLGIGSITTTTGKAGSVISGTLLLGYLAVFMLFQGSGPENSPSPSGPVRSGPFYPVGPDPEDPTKERLKGNK